MAPGSVLGARMIAAEAELLWFPCSDALRHIGQLWGIQGRSSFGYGSVAIGKWLGAYRILSYSRNKYWTRPWRQYLLYILYIYFYIYVFVIISLFKIYITRSKFLSYHYVLCTKGDNKRSKITVLAFVEFIEGKHKFSNKPLLPTK